MQRTRLNAHLLLHPPAFLQYYFFSAIHNVMHIELTDYTVISIMDEQRAVCKKTETHKVSTLPCKCKKRITKSWAMCYSWSYYKTKFFFLLNMLTGVSVVTLKNLLVCWAGVITWPPLVVEKILMVPPHCLTYQRNQRAEISWGSEVTFTLTNSVAKRRAVLHGNDLKEHVCSCNKKY